MSSADQWRWTDDEGVQRLLNGEELRAALRDGRLKPTTLVWRRGMRSWQPASEIEELMIEEETVETVTQEAPTKGKPPGVKRPPTPSIPAPGTTGVRVPSNMINIAGLRAQQSGKRPRTMHGLGDGRAKPPDAQPVRIPMAPRVPSLGYRGGDADKAAAVISGAETVPDGAWKEGAARSDEEETVTTLRRDPEDSTLAGQQTKKKKAKRSVPPPRKGSAPPPGRKRTIPPARGRVPSNVARTLASAGEQAKDVKVPDPVPSSAVLSEAFPSSVGKSGPGASGKIQLSAEDRTLPAPPEPPEKAKVEARKPEPARKQATAPLPAVRPDKPSRPDPKFAAEPWEKPEPVPAAPPPAPVVPGTSLGARHAVHTPPPSAKPGSITLAIPLAAAGAGAVVVLLLVAFFLGRWSAPAEAGISAAAEARSGWTAVPLFARTRTRAGASQRPCLMLRAPSRYADSANHRIPVEMLPADEGKLALGYSASSTEPRGMLVDLARGTTEEVYSPEELAEPLARVTPLRRGGAIAFEPTLAEREGVRNATYTQGETPFLIGFGPGALVRLPAAGGVATELWSVEAADRADALSALPLGAAGTAIAYRAANKIWYGIVDAKGQVKQAAVQVAGSGGIVGKPNLGSNGSELSVVFADVPPADEGRPAAEIRWARGPFDKKLLDAAALELPDGGPGGDAIAPAIAGLTGGRWLLMWTEGKAGNQVLRAQTYDRKYRPLGEALRVSPETGSFGQGMVGVVGETAAVVFFRATAADYEIWGTVLQCE